MPIMNEIVYTLMLKMYERHRNQTPDCGQPEVDVQKYIPKKYKVNEFMQEEYLIKVEKEVFGTSGRLTRIKVEEILTSVAFHLLRPTDIRQLAHKNMTIG